MNTNIIIRKALTDDFESIKRMMLQALETDPTAFTASQAEYMRNSDYWWNMYIDPYLRAITASMFLAEENGETVGMIGVLYSTKERSQHVSTIVWFYVAPEHRSKKIGSALINASLEDIKSRHGIKKINLTVTSNQKHAIAMYEKNGFVEGGRQKDELLINGTFYDFIIMEKFL